MASGEGRVQTRSVMFTDLVGSTELRGRLGEDGAERLRIAHDRVVHDAIESHDGVVVKHTGDGVMATFDGAADAVSAAVEVQRRVDLASRSGDLDGVHMRVGLSVGDVTVTDDDCFGLPVVEAQRLEASAEPGTIRCADAVRFLAKGRGGHRFVPLGALELKGFAEPLDACEVLWEPIVVADDVDTALPPVLRSQVGFEFAGRVSPLAELAEAWHETQSGAPGLVLVAGEPGVGKTRLVSELARQVIAGGAVVLAGRCDEQAPSPYEPFADALDWYVARAESIGGSPRLGELAADLVALVPDLPGRVAGLGEPTPGETHGDRRVLARAVHSWLEGAAGDSGVLVVLDDLHWADRSTLWLLDHLVREPPANTLVVATYRDTDVSRAHALSEVLSALRRRAEVRRIVLEGLDEAEIAELLERAGGHELDDDGRAFARLLRRETSGNPFFVSEVLRHLAATGAIAEREGRWVGAKPIRQGGIPEGIRDVVGQRLARLGDGADAILSAAAIIGSEFDLDLLVEVGRVEVDDVLDVLDAAVEASLLTETSVGRYAFAHALVRQTLVEELSSTRRARTHARVAEALERHHGDDLDAVIERIATHLVEAAAGGDPTRAIEASQRAGEVAADRFAHDHAVEWFDRVVELIDDDPHLEPERRCALTARARSEAWVSGRDPSRSISEAARSALADGDGRGAVLALLASPAGVEGGIPFDPDRVSLLEAVLVGDAPEPGERGQLLAHLAHQHRSAGDHEAADAVLDEIDELYPRLSAIDRGRTLGHAMDTVRDMYTERTRRICQWLEEALEVEDDPVWRVRHRATLPQWTLHAVDRDGIDEMLEGLRRAEAHGGRAAGSSFVATWVALLDGDLESAERELGRYEGAASQSTSESTGFLLRFQIERELDRLAASLPLLRDLAAVPEARPFAAWGLAETGHLDEAASLLSATDLTHVSAAYTPWAEVAAAVGTQEQVDHFITDLEPRRGLFLAIVGCHRGAVDHLLGTLLVRRGDHVAADEYFTAAVDIHTALRSPPWIARTHLPWAALHLDRADPLAARTHLDRATEAIGDLDLPAIRRQLAELTVRL